MKFRDLRANEIDARVGQVGDGYCTLLLYKDARVDMDILDETVGEDSWQRRHYEVKGNLYCSVGIKTLDNGWVWKDDCGTESNTEKEKGESSDSFKRACVNWGIGRELYTAPLIRVDCATTKNDKGKLIVKDLTSFSVADIVIENKTITGLQIKAYDKENKTTDIVFSWGKLKDKTKGENTAKTGLANRENGKVEQVVEKEEDKPITLKEALGMQVKTRDGWKKLKDLETDKLELIVSHTTVKEWIEGAKLIIADRKKNEGSN